MHRTGNCDAESAAEVDPDASKAEVSPPFEAIQNLDDVLIFPWNLRKSRLGLILDVFSPGDHNCSPRAWQAVTASLYGLGFRNITPDVAKWLFSPTIALAVFLQSLTRNSLTLQIIIDQDRDIGL